MSLQTLIATKGVAATVKRPALTQGALAEEVRTLSTVQASAVVMAQPASTSLTVAYAQQQARVTHSLYITRSALTHTPAVGDLWVVGARTFRVVGIRNFDEAGRLYRLDAEEIGA